jgi:hypothetical protein
MKRGHEGGEIGWRRLIGQMLVKADGPPGARPD